MSKPTGTGSVDEATREDSEGDEPSEGSEPALGKNSPGTEQGEGASPAADAELADAAEPDEAAQDEDAVKEEASQAGGSNFPRPITPGIRASTPPPRGTSSGRSLASSPAASMGRAKPEAAASVAPPRPTSSGPPRPSGRELKAPERKLVLSDLFDSAPPPAGSLDLDPPGTGEFWSSRPPTGSRAPGGAAPPRPASSSRPARVVAPPRPTGGDPAPARGELRPPSSPQAALHAGLSPAGSAAEASARPLEAPPQPGAAASSPTAAEFERNTPKTSSAAILHEAKTPRPPAAASSPAIDIPKPPAVPEVAAAISTPIGLPPGGGEANAEPAEHAEPTSLGVAGLGAPEHDAPTAVGLTRPEPPENAAPTAVGLSKPEPRPADLADPPGPPLASSPAATDSEELPAGEMPSVGAVPKPPLAPPSEPSAPRPSSVGMPQPSPPIPAASELESVEETVPLDLQREPDEARLARPLAAFGSPAVSAEAPGPGAASPGDAPASSEALAASAPGQESPVDLPAARRPELVATLKSAVHGAAPESEEVARESAPPASPIMGGAAAEGEPVDNASVIAAVPSARSPDDHSLPSVMIADEASSPEAEARERAARASKATMRIELPDGFGKPGVGIQLPTGEYLPGVPPQVAPPARRGPLSSPKALWAVATVMLLATLGLLVYRLSVPTTGQLVVNAQGPGGSAVDEVEITIDESVTCHESPCQISELKPGPHTITATGKGMQDTEEVAEVEAGRRSVHTLRLSRVVARPKAGSIVVPAAEQALTLFVDEARIGRLPQTVPGLSAGRHWLRLVGTDGRVAVEKPVNVVAGEQIEVLPTPPVSTKGLVTIQLASSSRGASVTLDDAFLLDFPAELELEPGRPHVLSASKPGFRDFTTEIEVEVGQPREIIEIDLRRGVARSRNQASKKAARKKKRRRARSKKRSSKASTFGDGTQGRLTLRSIPRANVILNGRPVGTTPKVGLLVPGNTMQTIVFIHPEKGRRRAQQFVRTGETETVSIKF